MDMVITFGILGAFFVGIITLLYVVNIRDKGFTDYAVAGRSFGPVYQTMSFVNTWWPGTVFISFAGLSAGAGVLGFYALSYTMLTIVLMYVMAKRVWRWGAKFDLRTQSDLFSVRFRSRHIKTVVAVIGVLTSFPWIVLGMQAMGMVFSYMSFGELSLTAGIVLGAAVLAIRQIWTIQMGMRGVVITDLYQGIVAYFLGTALIVGLIVWLAGRGTSLSEGADALFTFPALNDGGPGALYVFALIFTGALGGWCWPAIFVRLYTADGVRSLKRSAAYGAPVAGIFYGLLTLVAIMGAINLDAVANAPQEVWFILTETAGGPLLLALAGTVVFAATMGNIDGNIQANGAQVANDMVGNYRSLDDRQLVNVARLGMVVLVVGASVVASLNLPALVTLAIISYQGIIQLAVPQFLGIFFKWGNKYGAIGGMVAGFVTACVLEAIWRDFLPWAAGLTSGVVGLAVNLLVYVGAAILLPHSPEERERIDDLFATADRARSRAPKRIPPTIPGEAAPQVVS
jgi:SSS family solute:Na+ symporter